ncbi:MAG: zinc ribbon domain-containing protein [Humidesulfovibrio sp.]|uniref:FmdB family zinc ribbon protein n=1 Tax=Humidesulfovibrio sp. TaxID=2910988 RepID=UPI002736D8EA|nr:zinc ribbon domain-containing protein [Humidesulfovibrio sp.]MDP2848562.1 zinc ribbon domain-containing protein [Humidesulfovibrio sp.]
MPIYEYNCQDCKQLFEEWQKDYEERDIPCPVCGGNASRIISSTSFVLKGGGWYASGYSGPAPSGSAGAEAPASAPATDAVGAKPAEAASVAPAPAAAAPTATAATS